MMGSSEYKVIRLDELIASGMGLNILEHMVKRPILYKLLCWWILSNRFGITSLDHLLLIYVGHVVQ